MKYDDEESLESGWNKVVEWFALALFLVVAIILWAPHVLAAPPQLIIAPPAHLDFYVDKVGYTIVKIDVGQYQRVADGTFIKFTNFHFNPDEIFKNNFAN